MMLKPPLASLVAATAFWAASPAAALPPLDDLELELKGEAQGWVNATCTYYGMGWLTEEQGTNALRRLCLSSMVPISAKLLDRRQRKQHLKETPAANPFGPISLSNNI